MELWKLDATDLARMIRLGQVSAREVTESTLARMHAVNPTLNAVVRPLDEEALATADRLDQARSRGEIVGPLHGVPVTTKVNVDQAGHPNDNGVPALKDNIAAEDSPVVANLKQAGAVIVGRTNTPSFSMRIFTDNALHGKTWNPLDRAISPGGSSGGAGASVASGIGAIAHGNDIAGSVRAPAYCCGVVGLRVSLGRIAAYNPSALVARPLGAQLMAVQGPLTRTVRDSRLAFAAMSAADRSDTRWVDAPLVGPAPPRPIKVALVPELPGGFTHPAQAEAVRRAGRHLQRAGYAVEEVMPPDIETIIDTWHKIGVTDVLGALWPRVREHADDKTRGSMTAWMTQFPPTDLAGYMAALGQRDLSLQHWLTFLESWPLVVMPTLADLPPPQDQDTTPAGKAKVLESLRACLIAPVLGIPALQVPVGRHGNLRTGVQIKASRFREDLCLDAGEVIEAAEGIVGPVDPVAA